MKKGKIQEERRLREKSWGRHGWMKVENGRGKRQGGGCKNG